jgi:uncharacterized protein YaaW (UPF0174 family)
LGTTEKELDLQMQRSGTRADAQKISHYLRKMGSNDIASLFRSGEGVKYEEIVCDVGEKLRLKESAKTSQ